MKWVSVNKAHFNTDLILSFHWSAGKLWVWWLGDKEPEWYKDPDQEGYFELCRFLNVSPCEEDVVCG